MTLSEDLSADNLDSDSLKPVYNLIELGLEEYEDNKLVLNTVHDLIQFFKKYSNFFQIRGLEKSELVLFLKAQLMAFEINNKNVESQRQNYRYNYNASLLLCKPVFLKLCGINNHFLLAIQKHLQENGLTERTHRNTGCIFKLKSKVYLDSSITFSVKCFLKQYGNINGLPSPMRYKNESEPFIYLPTGNIYTSVYNEFKYFYKENGENTKVIFYFTFRRLWYEIIPYLKFQPPASDLCEVYQNHRVNTISNIEHVINNSSKGNNPILYNNELGWTCSLSTDIGKVYASTESGRSEISFQLLCKNNFDINTTLKTILIKLLAKERKYYLFTKIRQYIDDPYKDVYCANLEKTKDENK
ncbi:14350_t:CDS:2 [Dentiscutata heterogama]|uniref:14350_t:CDS:1 n=1 Tax=Dentiscutata heterogama TaxID=1316150 RepID=A0ACA9K5W8_9GLOM|nr:14350_t:CDS:2 [Dentiscutata heterogama]